ncbi:MAG: hypothetical protein PHE27_09260 [Alphaproteobacteria bacterium]|nr:hypothetical protein [Alphaproteobacteria bacterium]
MANRHAAKMIDNDAVDVAARNREASLAWRARMTPEDVADDVSEGMPVPGKAVSDLKAASRTVCRCCSEEEEALRRRRREEELNAGAGAACMMMCCL